ncbi:MAG: hypothetical protein K2I08_01360 [Muribaculaceae bacterium]|nr:hypothetical protein [Muribaculaceae bacterium]
MPIACFGISILLLALALAAYANRLLWHWHLIAFGISILSLALALASYCFIMEGLWQEVIGMLLTKEGDGGANAVSTRKRDRSQRKKKRPQ